MAVVSQERPRVPQKCPNASRRTHIACRSEPARSVGGCRLDAAKVSTLNGSPVQIGATSGHRFVAASWLAAARVIDRLAANGVRRRVVLTAIEIALPLVSVTAAAAIGYSGDYARWSPRLALAAPILIVLQLGAGVLTGAFAGRWRFVGVRDAASITRSALIAGGAGLLVLHWLQLVDTSLRLVGADTSIYIMLSCGARLGSRWLHEWGRRTAASSGATWRRAGIIGAGESG